MRHTEAPFDPITQANVNRWLGEAYDAETKATIRRLLSENPQEIIDAFYTNLTFGTGGLRGIMGVGTNRINLYTVRATTQGLAHYLKQEYRDDPKAVFIGYDSRHFSRQFAEETAKVFAGNGIKAYVCKNIRPTPYVSFGCRFKQCQAAVMITASHNPPEYNGYKVYWDDGGQVLPPHDRAIIAQVNKITELSMIHQAACLDDPLIEFVEEEIDQAYLQAISSLQLYPDENQTEGKDLKMVYTSMHGTGITLMPQALKLWGFSQVHYVENQNVPDGNFPTAHSPNPEERAALSLGIQRLEREKADLLIATDPDADRLGVAVYHQGQVEILTGNQVACICLEHICEALTQQNRLPERAAFVKTIVTTELFKSIAESFHKTCFSVLPGFKYIAELIREWEHNPKGYAYVFGGEESCGYLLGTYARDKDAILAGALICEAALHAKRKNKTLVDLLHALYRKHGFYMEKLATVQFKDTKSGREQMARGMFRLQSSPPPNIAGIEVIAIEDFSLSLKTFLKTGLTESIPLPKSSVLLFWLADGSKVIIRPSGTEPKIKIYCGIKNKYFENIKDSQAACSQLAERILTQIHALCML
ncbi:MAG: phosphomannomutase [Parachlamydia sp.]|nr:MAG: phosphomannomutase [Parachlamydia sp.]